MEQTSMRLSYIEMNMEPVYLTSKPFLKEVLCSRIEMLGLSL